MIKYPMTKTLLRILMCAALPVSAAFGQAVSAPAYSTARVQQLAAAIARAEGFGVRGSRPTRNNNPGDIRTAGVRYPGQRRIAAGRYVVFATPADGWAALQAQIVRILEGRSRYYTLHTTINQMSRRYAETWQPWAKQVARGLRVPGTTTLGDYLTGGDLDVAPQFTFGGAQ